MLILRAARPKVIAVAVLAALCTLAGVFIGTSGARADNGCVTDPFGSSCGIGVTNPGSPGTGGTQTPGGGGYAPAGFTPGPTTCSSAGKTIPCQTDQGWWSAGGVCTNGYVALEDPQATPPAGENAGVGAWYWCRPICPAGAIGCYSATFWSNTPPPGVITYTPAQAAAALAKTFVLTGINIGMAPADKVHTDDPVGTGAYRRTWVGIPVWLWVASPTPTTWGPYSKSASLGGVTVTATAAVTGVTWSGGDGQTVNCGAGTAFNEAAMQTQLATDSPTCGFRFQHTSSSQPGGVNTVTATSHWVVQWTGGGTNGTIAEPDVSSAAQVRVGQLQSVNTNLASVDGYGK